MIDEGLVALLIVLIVVVIAYIIIVGIELPDDQGQVYKIIYSTELAKQISIKPLIKRMDGSEYTLADSVIEYIFDNNTGIVYIAWFSQNRFGLSPAYNSDGTVMTKEQLLNMPLNRF